MAGFFPQAFLEDLRQHCDLVEIVSQVVPLKQKGRKYWACCPFHSEKTPSFSVDADKQMYYCFGCKASGNVYNFVMETERLDFVSAVEHLAEKVNLPLPKQQDAGKLNAQRKGRQRLQNVMRIAARYFRDRLFGHEGQAALAYIKNRDISEAIVKRFGLGYAPDSWHALADHLKESGVSEKDAMDAGLLSSSKGRIYDRFRNRLMFPIFSAQGDVVAFGGRVMGEGEPKYLNSPETPIFDKSRTLYGLHRLKHVRDLKRIVIVEGYMDMLSLEQAGIIGAVATMGTAMTREQARMLRRYCDRVTLAYDDDMAGQQAALRGMEILTSEGLNVKVLRLEGGMDPDDFVRKKGAQAIRERIESAMPLPEFEMMLEKKKHDLEAQEGRTEYAIACAKILAKLPDPVEREVYLKILAVQTGFSMESLGAQVARHAGQNAVVTPYKRAQKRYNKEEVFGNSPRIRAEKQLVGGLARSGEPTRSRCVLKLEDAMFTQALTKRAYALMRAAADEKRNLAAADLLTQLTLEGFSREDTGFIAQDQQQDSPTEQALEEWVLYMRQMHHKQIVQELKDRLSAPDLSERQRQALMQQIQEETAALRQTGKEGTR
ncbi:MAG: DNA primase [Christensenellales bacterium]|jgi:DNA primase